MFTLGLRRSLSSVTSMARTGQTRSVAKMTSVQLRQQLETVKSAITNVENMHRSNAEHLIDAMPIIDVHGGVAVCDGGGGALGHPIEYIQLNMVEEGVENECKYCGLRFRSVGGHH